MSPYITHGILSENEVIRESLKKHSYLTSEKFIQEILWRIYWRGWLELRPQVWKNYLKNLKKLKDEFKDNRKYIQVTEGNSNIECFNDWVKELKESNYNVSFEKFNGGHKISINYLKKIKSIIDG